MRGFLLFATTLCAAAVCAQGTNDNTPGMTMPGMTMPGMTMSGPPAAGAMNDAPEPGDGSASAMQAMQGHHLDVGPHMKMTSMPEIKPGDREKADQVVNGARAAAAKYQDHKAALADGYKIFLPDVPQKQYHFTNYWYAFRARNHFDPTRPTSLLYEKRGDDYKLIGVMYTAKKDASEGELNSRIPLSIAQWHAHVNLCMPPKDRRQEAIPPHAKFGLAGSISSQQECQAEGGRFYPQVFGWMVHVYPFEQKQEDIWSVERQHHHGD
jgi:hypothetical protein